MVECQTCHGQYEPIGLDGVRYFHACPPLGLAELHAALDAGALQLSVVNRARLTAAQKTDAAHPPAPGEPTHVDLLLASLVVERPNKRDENIAGPPLKDGEEAPIKSAGAGVLDVVSIDDGLVGPASIGGGATTDTSAPA